MIVADYEGWPEPDPACLNCGHPRSEHRPVMSMCLGRDRALPMTGHYEECGHQWGGHGLGYHECSCPRYVHDALPLVSNLIGRKTRLDIERAVA